MKPLKIRVNCANTDAGRAIRSNAIPSIFLVSVRLSEKIKQKLVLVDYWPIKNEFSSVVCLFDLRFYMPVQ